MIKKYLSLLFVSFLLLFAACSNNAQETGTPEGGDSEIQNRDTENGVTEPEQEISNIAVSLTASGAYEYPKGFNVMDLTLDLDSEGKVVSYKMELQEPEPVSEGYVDKFSEGAEQFIIGKTLDEIDLPQVISGSSLTIAGFQEALLGIKNQQ